MTYFPVVPVPFMYRAAPIMNALKSRKLNYTLNTAVNRKYTHLSMNEKNESEETSQADTYKSQQPVHVVCHLPPPPLLSSVGIHNNFMSPPTDVSNASSTVGESNNNTVCCSDPFVTADTYRQYATHIMLETDAAAAASNQQSTTTAATYQVYYVNNRPYIPQWRVEIVKEETDCCNDGDDPYQSVKSIAAVILWLQQPPHEPPTTTTTTTTISPDAPDIVSMIQNIAKQLSVERVMGGVTNTLYRVSGFQTMSIQDDDYTTTSALSFTGPDCDNVLVRIFGAEGLIDRDDETSVFAALSQYQLAPAYYGRFQNGRVEGYQDGMRPLQFHELSTGPTSIARGIASNLARLHYGFRILPTLSVERSQPTLWKQLLDWLDQAEAASFELESERQSVLDLDLPTIRPELIWLQDEVEKVIDWSSDPIVFCHNDLLAANILYNDSTETVRLIDFEYGGINYRSFDIANHFNEYAGGPPTETRPDYNLLPSEPQQRYFIRSYLETAAATTAARTGSKNNTTPQTNGHGATTHEQDIPHIEESQIDTMMKEVELFLIINHLYWGLWGINQASTEGCTVYDYMTYGVNRIQQYWKQRSKIR